MLLVSNSDPTLTTVRAQIATQVGRLGFAVTTWVDGGFPFVAGSSAHEVSIELAEDAEVLVALIGVHEGTALRSDADHMRPALREALTARRVIPPSETHSRQPTVLEAEILTAIRAGLPTVVFVERETRRIANRVRGRVESRVDRLRALSADAPAATTLIEEGRWQELGWWYECPDLELEGMSLGRACFLIDIDSGSPYVGVKPVDLGDPADVEADVRSVLGQAAALVAASPRWRREDGPVGRMVATARNPLGTASLRALVDEAQLVDPPFEVDGSPVIGVSLRAYLSEHLGARRSIVVVGEPGVGKTTAHLLAAWDACQIHPPISVLAGRWRDLPAETDSLMSSILGTMRKRDRWPVAVQSARWIVAIDGLDESKLEVKDSADLIRAAHSEADSTVLLTCRAQSWERSFHALLGGEFDRIVTLTEWGSDQIDDYLARLRTSGRDSAATAIEREFRSSGAELEFLAYPLWLSMLAYLVSDPSRPSPARLASEVDVLRDCARAVATAERTRVGLEDEPLGWLQDIWGKVAWRLHVAKGPLKAERLFQEVGVPDSKPHLEAVRSVLDLANGGADVSGFFHQVFADFWLSRYIASGIVHDTLEGVQSGDGDEVANLFSFHRSRLVNRLIRGRLDRPERVGPAMAALQAAYSAAGDTFTRNQLVYLMSRVGDGRNRPFLAEVWYTADDEFVRYSAGFAATIAGDEAVENEFYETLVAGGSMDEIARGYHLVYYGDISAIDESGLPYHDDGSGGAAQAEQNLARRLLLPDERYRRLRRIETVILRRLVETHGVQPGNENSIVAVAEQVTDEARRMHSGQFAEKLLSEAAGLLRALRED